MVGDQGTRLLVHQPQMTTQNVVFVIGSSIHNCLRIKGRALFIRQCAPGQNPIRQVLQDHKAFAALIVDCATRHANKIAGQKTKVVFFQLRLAFDAIQTNPKNWQQNHQDPNQQIGITRPVDPAKPTMPMSSGQKRPNRTHTRACRAVK